jgi:hypothetical protein
MFTAMLSSNFAFNLLDKAGITEKVYAYIANLLNRHVLRRNTFDTELIAGAFDALDGFWLKYGRTKWYNESQIRVIVGVVLESLRDNQLDAAEIRRLTRVITGEWKPEIAESKVTADPATLLPAKVEETVTKALEIYEEVKVSKKQIPLFVEKTAALVSKSVSTDKIVGSFLKFFR